TIEPNFADWMSLTHYCALSSLHITIDAAFAQQNRVRMHKLFFEHEVINASAEKGAPFRLHTTVNPLPAIYCCPDSAFEIEISNHRRAIFIEREMGSDLPARVVAKKHKGYALLAEK